MGKGSETTVFIQRFLNQPWRTCIYRPPAVRDHCIATNHVHLYVILHTGNKSLILSLAPEI